ncbi:MAG: hypothetical protein PHU07_12090 [Acidocella sp.]|nr:hypothetical protein [Acidocella sp.]
MREQENSQTPFFAPRRDDARESLRGMVQAVATGVDTAEAAEEAALAELRSDPVLAEQAMRLGLRQLIGDLRVQVRRDMLKQRRAEWNSSQAAPRSFARAMTVRASFYDWPLPNSGVLLGDATALDLEAAAAFHDSHRDAHARRGAAYRQISGILAASKRNGPVRAVIAEAELGRILAGVPT